MTRETGYLLNSEKKRLCSIMADALSEAYDRMADETGLNYSVDDGVQKLLKLIGCENESD